MKHLENRGYSLMSALETISSMQTNSKISKRIKHNGDFMKKMFVDLRIVKD